VAIIVDVRFDKGAIRIFEQGGSDRVGAVTMDEAGYMVIVPWESNWWFRASGSLQVGYVQKSTPV
jgi:hypothetical protein